MKLGTLKIRLLLALLLSVLHFVLHGSDSAGVQSGSHCVPGGSPGVLSCSSLWFKAKLDMSKFDRSLPSVSVSSEIQCAVVASMRNSSIYCYDGVRCQHGPDLGPNAPPQNGVPERNCKTNQGIRKIYKWMSVTFIKRIRVFQHRLLRLIHLS